MFAIRKWYLDCVTDAGTVFIGYAATLRWGWVRLGYSSYYINAPDGFERQAASWHSRSRPQQNDGLLRWKVPGLHLHGEWRGAFPRIDRLLYEEHGNHVRWICHQPAAHARIRVDDVAIEGLGYTEELRVTIPPWQLPIEELQWGRFVSDTNSVVWIKWAGPQPLSLAFVNGCEVPDFELALDDTRTIRRNSLASLLKPAPFVGNALAARFGGTLEHKMLSRGTFGVLAPDQGWTIHETVKWRARQRA